ncbi:MAG: hypothetical protein JWM48_2113, partial [Mycobacterium sp.]|nr:hypothetical protein [Mycobacterium sp.]
MTPQAAATGGAPTPGVTPAPLAAHPSARQAAEAFATSHSAPLAPPVTLPTPGSATVNVPILPGGKTRAGSLPIYLSAPSGGAGPASVHVSMLGDDAARKGGGLGLALQLTRADGNAASTTTSVTVDYSSFAQLYGGGFADRLVLRTEPNCDVASALVTSCPDAGVALPVVNDAAHQTLTAQVPVAGDPAAPVASPLFRHPSDVSLFGSAKQSAGANPLTAGRAAQAQPHVTTATSSVVLASSASGGAGSYEATPLSSSGKWQTGGASGTFTYNYSLKLPPATVGQTPPLGLSYDSGSVDNRTMGTNPQAAGTGLGWSLTTGEIDQQFQPCSVNHTGWGELCFNSVVPSLQLTLNGQSGLLLPDPNNPGTYHLDIDPG